MSLCLKYPASRWMGRSQAFHVKTPDACPQFHCNPNPVANVWLRLSGSCGICLWCLGESVCTKLIIIYLSMSCMENYDVMVMYWYCPFHFLWSMLDSCYMSMFILSLLPISVTIMGKYSHLIDIRLCFISFYIDWLRRETPKDAKKVYFAIELDLLSYKISKYIFLIFDWNKLSRQTKSVLSIFHSFVLNPPQNSISEQISTLWIIPVLSQTFKSNFDIFIQREFHPG